MPLISLLFMSSVMLPLFLPEGFSIDKLLRADRHHHVRGGLHRRDRARRFAGDPEGQYEGADSLGLNYWQQMRKIILPQALKIVIPPLVSIFIALFRTPRWW